MSFKVFALCLEIRGGSIEILFIPSRRHARSESDVAIHRSPCHAMKETCIAAPTAWARNGVVYGGLFTVYPHLTDRHSRQPLLKGLLFLQKGRGSLELLLKFLSLSCRDPVAPVGLERLTYPYLADMVYP